MRQASIIGASVVFVLALLLCWPGCSTDERHAGPSEPLQPEQTLLMTVPEKEHQVILQEALSHMGVEQCAEVFERQELGKAPVSSVSLEGKLLDGAPFTLTILAFQGADSAVAGFIAYIKGRGRTVVSPCIVRNEQGSIGSGEGGCAFAEFWVTREGLAVPIEDTGSGEYSVTKQGVAIPIGETGSGVDSAKGGFDWDWNWGTFWNCVQIQTRAVSPVVSGCLVACAVSGPFYLKCALACGAGGAVRITTECVLQQLDD